MTTSQTNTCKHENVKDGEPKGTTVETITILSAQCLDCGARGIRPIGREFTAYEILEF